MREECWVLTEGTEEEEDGGGLNGLSGTIIGAAIEVHRELGPGMLESAYEAAATSRNATCVAFINQLRQKIGVVYGNPETTTGGNATTTAR